MVDTSREKVDRIADLLTLMADNSDHGRKPDPSQPYRRGAAIIRALLSERDTLRARAEKAEAERDAQKVKALSAMKLAVSENNRLLMIQAERDQASADLAAAKAKAVEVMVKIADNKGRCSVCGKEAEGSGSGIVICDVNDYKCRWETVDPAERARALVEEWK